MARQDAYQPRQAGETSGQHLTGYDASQTIRIPVIGLALEQIPVTETPDGSTSVFTMPTTVTIDAVTYDVYLNGEPTLVISGWKQQKRVATVWDAEARTFTLQSGSFPNGWPDSEQTIWVEFIGRLIAQG